MKKINNKDKRKLRDRKKPPITAENPEAEIMLKVFFL